MPSYPPVHAHDFWTYTYANPSMTADNDPQQSGLYDPSGEPAASFRAGSPPSLRHLTGYAESQYVPTETTVASHSLHHNNPVLYAGSQGGVTIHQYPALIVPPSHGYGDTAPGSTRLVSRYSGPGSNGWVNHTNDDSGPGSTTFRRTLDHTEIAHRLDAARCGNAFEPPLPAQRPATLEYECAPLDSSESAYTIAQNHLSGANRCSWSRTSAIGGMTFGVAPKTAGINGTCSVYAGQALRAIPTEDPTTLARNEPLEAPLQQPAQGNADSLAWYHDYLGRPEVQRAMDHNRNACLRGRSFQILRPEAT